MARPGCAVRASMWSSSGAGTRGPARLPSSRGGKDRVVHGRKIGERRAPQLRRERDEGGIYAGHAQRRKTRTTAAACTSTTGRIPGCDLERPRGVAARGARHHAERQPADAPMVSACVASRRGRGRSRPARASEMHRDPRIGKVQDPQDRAAARGARRPERHPHGVQGGRCQRHRQAKRTKQIKQQKQDHRAERAVLTQGCGARRRPGRRCW